MINRQNADAIKARFILEAANAPTIPDVTVSYFEWVQNLQQFYWDEEQVNRKLAKRMERAWNEVRAVQREKDADLRRAADMIAIDRVARAESLRGFK